MKVLFLTNGSVGDSLLNWLSGRVEEQRREDPVDASTIREAAPDLVVSYSYRHIIRQDVLDLMPGRFINLHISMLPFNRGADPNAWSFLDGTPKGVTIHIIDAGIDTGPILFQRAVEFDDSETLGGSYARLQETIQALFKENWRTLASGTAVATAQPAEAGTFHKAKEFAAIKERLMGAEGWHVTIGDFKRRHREMLAEFA